MSSGKSRPTSIPRSIEAFVEKRIPSSEELDCEKRGYKLSRTTLGRGAYAKVKLAYVTNAKLEKDHALREKLRESKENKVAIKIISRKSAPVEYLNKFMPREIETLNTTYGCPHVIKLYEHFRSEHRIYLVMEYANKGDLLEFINSGASKAPGIGEAKAKKFFWQLAKGIEHCHRKNVVHRDLKCENVLIHDDDLIKISDFGFATRFPTTRMPLLDTFCGSYAYAAPEILLAEKYDGKIADIWSLGVVLFAMLNGKLPFNDKNVSSLIDQTRGSIKFSTRVQVTQECQDLVKRILTANLQKRITITEILRHPWFDELSTASQPRGVPDGKSDKCVVPKQENGISISVDLRNDEPKSVKPPLINDATHPIASVDKTKWIEKNSNRSTMTKLLKNFTAKQTIIESKETSTPGPLQQRIENEAKNKTIEGERDSHNLKKPHHTAATAATKILENQTVSSNGYIGYRHQSERPDSRESKLEKRRGAAMKENRWNEVTMPVSNMKTSGFYRLYYPGLKNAEKGPSGFSLPPVPSNNRSSSSNSGRASLKAGTESKNDGQVTKPPASVCSNSGNSRWAPVTTEIINLRSNWPQGRPKRKDTRKAKENTLTYVTLSGKEVDKSKPAVNQKIKAKLNVFGRAPRAPRYKVD